MGFCFLNNVAVAAQVVKTTLAAQGVRRILILDWCVGRVLESADRAGTCITVRQCNAH